MIAPDARTPLVIAHRGASMHRPEHTLASYALAIEAGADFIEPDLVITGDGVLVARHENEISGTTDVATRPEFAARRAEKEIDDVPVTGWFVEDFTLAEIRSLRARERLPALRPASAAHDGRYLIPTFHEVLALATAHGVGVYPETKHPTHFEQMGLPLEPPLLDALRRFELERPGAPVLIQSFETGNLRRLREQTPVRLVQLLEASGAPYDLARAGDAVRYADLATPAGLSEIARYADAIGAAKTLILPRDQTERSVSPTTLIEDAHAAGLQVHAWTFRSENAFLPAELRLDGPAAARGDAMAEYRRFAELGVDGFFSDDPAEAVRFRGTLRQVRDGRSPDGPG